MSPRHVTVAWMAVVLTACSSAVGDGGSIVGAPGPGPIGDGPGAASPPSGSSATPNDAGATGSNAPPSGSSTGAGAVEEDAGSPPPPPTAGTDAGSSCAGAIVCEDFESFPAGALDLPDAGATWQIETPDCSGTGALVIDASEAHSGARSLKVTGAAGYCNHVFLGTGAVASLSGDVWARFYVRLATPLDMDHATLLAMRDTSTNTDLRMGGQDSVLMWNRESDDATLPAMSPMGTALSLAPATNAWHCVELDVSATGPTLSTWVDGALVTGLVAGGSDANPTADGQWVSNATWAPHLVDARFGWESYASEAETLWFDDVAIGAQRIGCGS